MKIRKAKRADGSPLYYEAMGTGGGFMPCGKCCFNLKMDDFKFGNQLDCPLVRIEKGKLNELKLQCSVESEEAGVQVYYREVDPLHAVLLEVADEEADKV